MKGGSVEHNFEREPPKDHPCQVWFNLVQGFQRRFKCESLQHTTDGRRWTLSDGKSSHGLCPGELKRGCHGRDRMVVGFTTTYAISAYHH